MRRSSVRIVGWLLALVVVGVCCFWAGRTVTRTPTASASTGAESMEVTVTTSSVGRSLTYNVTITQARVPVAENLLVGVVTSVRRADSYAVGDTVYAVDNHPVRVLTGDTPFFRDLLPGGIGPDVAELNSALSTLGYRAGTGSTFTADTEAGVSAWQRDLGLEQTGRIVRGELIAVPSLPSARFLDEETLRPGTVLAGGEQLVSTASGEPSFSLDLSAQQAQAVPASATVTITYEDTTWSAIITAQALKQDETSGATVTSMTLAAPDGGTVCGQECHLLPASERLYVPASIEIVPSVTGPAVPVTALASQPDGTTTVTLVHDGTIAQQQVTVVASIDGIAVVDGLTQGQVVRVYGSTAQDAAPASGSTGTGTGTGTATGTAAAPPAPIPTSTGTGQ